MPIVYYIVREAGTSSRDLAIHRVFDAATVTLQKIIHSTETEVGFDLFGVNVDDYGLFLDEWLIYSYRKGDTCIRCFGRPALTREYVYRPRRRGPSGQQDLRGMSPAVRPLPPPPLPESEDTEESSL